MKTRTLALALIATLLPGLAATAGAADGKAAPMTAQSHAQLTAQETFRHAMDKLWEDHIIWTRQFIVSAAAGLPDKAAATERLLQNQVDIGNAIKPYYGDAAGTQLTTLLKEHITIAADLVTAAKANDTVKVDAAKKKWVANADQISAFLTGANPTNWPAGHTKQMMRDHLDVTTEEVLARLKGDWAADIAAFEKVHAQILHMSGMLAEGIIKQFPQKFS